MSMMRCDHHGSWDSDNWESCPACSEIVSSTLQTSLVIDGYPDPLVWCNTCSKATTHNFHGMELVCDVCASIAVVFHPANVMSVEHVKNWLKRASDRRLQTQKPIGYAGTATALQLGCRPGQALYVELKEKDSD